MADSLQGQEVTYFVAKCQNMPALLRSINSGNWACRDRVAPPHPPDVLKAAFSQGKVILLFSVNNCHGWHGYCEMMEAPREVHSCSDSSSQASTSQTSVSQASTSQTSISQTSTSETSAPQTSVSQTSAPQVCVLEDRDTSRDADPGISCSQDPSQPWHYFTVRWVCQFLSDFGERCLNFSGTKDLLLEDGSPLNKSRNWQQVPGAVGRTLCRRMDETLERLAARRHQAERERLEQLPAPFLTEQGSEAGDVKRFWRRAVAKVETELGAVLLACPFGSQRYNTATPQSDIDVFIVYQAKTKDILGFSPPKQTIKNRDMEACDYTVLELQRYCELLVGGDPRCVETLFLSDASVMAASPQWRQLQDLRQSLLSRQCLEKYLKDAEGAKGVKQLLKWRQEHPDCDELTAKPSKLVYIILRLLQNARDIVQGCPLRVFREAGSPDLRLLMQARLSELSFTQAWQEIHSLQEEIKEKKDQVGDDARGKTGVENWLLLQRYTDFMLHCPQQI